MPCLHFFALLIFLFYTYNYLSCAHNFVSSVHNLVSHTHNHGLQSHNLISMLPKCDEYWNNVITNGREAPGRSSSTYYERERSARASFFNLWEKYGYEWPAGRPWSHFWEAYISATTRPIDKPSSVLDSPIPPTKYGTDADLSTWAL